MEEINLIRTKATENAPQSEYVIEVKTLSNISPIKSGLLQRVTNT